MERHENKKYRCNADKAYTNDGVLIYNVFVGKVPQKVTKEKLFRYFEAFGKVDRVDFSASEKTQNASVYFKDASVAARVLDNPTHFVEHEIFAVKACESWQQPHMKTQSRIKIGDKIREEGYDTTSHCSILQLNDDCLEIICKKLDLESQISFARVCERFEYIFQMACKMQYKELDVHKTFSQLTLWECRDFFKFTGQHVEKLTCTPLYDELEGKMEFIGNCTNIKSLKLCKGTIKSRALYATLGSMTNITKLELCYCNVVDTSMKILKKLPKLEILSLDHLSCISGKYLKDFKNLRELSIKSCENVTETNIIELKSLQKLTSLSLLKMHYTALRAIYELLRNCVNLKSLQTDVPITESLSFMPKLRKLDIETYQSYKLLIKLAEYKANQLQILKINYLTYESAKLVANLKQLRRLFCSDTLQLDDKYLYQFAELEHLKYLDVSGGRNITNAGLLHLLRKCLKLKWINLTYCTNITNEFVYEAVKLLEQTSLHRNYSTPLLCYAIKTNIDCDIMQDPIVAQSYLKVVTYWTAN